MHVAAIDFERDLDTPKVSKSKATLPAPWKETLFLCSCFWTPHLLLLWYSYIVMSIYASLVTLLCPGWRSSHRGITRISRVRMTEWDSDSRMWYQSHIPLDHSHQNCWEPTTVYPLYKLACSVTEVGTILQIWWRRELGTDPGGENLNEKIATGRG